MTSLLPRPLNDLSAAVTLIAEITGGSCGRETQARARTSTLGANVEQACACRLRPFEFSEELARFYAATDAFVYETFTWNRYPAKQQMRQWILDFLHAHYPGGVSWRMGMDYSLRGRQSGITGNTPGQPHPERNLWHASPSYCADNRTPGRRSRDGHGR